MQVLRMAESTATVFVGSSERAGFQGCLLQQRIADLQHR